MCMKPFVELNRAELEKLRKRNLEVEAYYCESCLKNDLIKLIKRFEKVCEDYKSFTDPYEKFRCKTTLQLIKGLIIKEVNAKHPELINEIETIENIEGMLLT